MFGLPILRHKVSAAATGAVVLLGALPAAAAPAGARHTLAPRAYAAAERSMVIQLDWAGFLRPGQRLSDPLQSAPGDGFSLHLTEDPGPGVSSFGLAEVSTSTDTSIWRSSNIGVQRQREEEGFRQGCHVLRGRCVTGEVRRRKSEPEGDRAQWPCRHRHAAEPCRVRAARSRRGISEAPAARRGRLGHQGLVQWAELSDVARYAAHRGQHPSGHRVGRLRFDFPQLRQLRRVQGTRQPLYRTCVVRGLQVDAFVETNTLGQRIMVGTQSVHVPWYYNVDIFKKVGVSPSDGHTHN